MSATPPAPAGWYPDVTNGNRMRYWDGARWTEQFAAPVVPAAQLKAPDGTDPNTPWIWLHLLVPLISIVPVFFVDWGAMFHIDPDNPQAMMQQQLALYTSPAYLLTIVLGWASYAAAIVFAYLDHRDLTRRGVPKPFHWAFAFLSSYVYPIGRGIVARRRTGRGIVVTWVAIALIVLSLVFAIVFTIVIFTMIFEQVTQLAPTTTL